MFEIKIIIFYVAFINVFDEAHTLVELPKVEENDILKAEEAIRFVTNKLFSILHIQKENQLKIQQYILVHNFFVSLTLQDYKNLKEIARLTRVDNTSINNETATYVRLLNEILDEDNHSEEHIENVTNAGDIEEALGNNLDDRLQNLGHLRYIGHRIPRVEINKEILAILTPEGRNITKSNEDYNALLATNEFWVPEPNARRIFKGQNVKVKYFPFMAAILIFKQFQCGGSIIHKDLVITASSCLQLAWNNRLYRENPAFLSVRVGSNFYHGGGEEIAVLEIYFHPDYNPSNLRNNLAVLRLVRKINFHHNKWGRGKVKKIKLDRNEGQLLPKTDGVTVVGWGAKTRGNIIRSPWENRLSFDVLDAYPLEDCQDIYSKEYVTRKHFCAGFLSKGSGACNRDVGGPGVVSGRLTGVISFGSPVCGTPDAPTVFTKVGYYYDWIEAIMRQHVPSIKKRTTTEVPYTFSFTTSRTETPFVVQPVEGISTEPMPIHTTEPPIADLRNDADVGLVGDYFKGMFHSKEVEKYLDNNITMEGKKKSLKIEKKLRKRQRKMKPKEKPKPNKQTKMFGEPDLIRTHATTPRSPSEVADPIDFVTKMGGIESFEIEDAETTQPDNQYTVMDNHNVYLIEEDKSEIKEDELNEEAEKELKRELMRLIDRTYPKEIVEASILDRGRANVKQSDLKTDDPNIDDTGGAKVTRDLKNIDDTILTLLLITNDEKGNDDVFDTVDNVINDNYRIRDGDGITVL